MIGAAVADTLAACGYSVTVVGAWYGDDHLFSSHEDETRIVRAFHVDPFWETLALANRDMLQELVDDGNQPQGATAPALFRELPVCYRNPPRPSDLLRHRSLPGDEDGFAWQDVYGGIVDPKAYIHALNRRAAKAGAKILRGVVRDVRRVSGEFRVSSSAGDIACERVVDARGIYSALEEREHARVVGKILVEFMADTTSFPEPFAFVDFAPEAAPFSELYGVLAYAAVGTRARSKLGFSDPSPVLLNDLEDVAAWFSGDYRRHPLLDDVRKWLSRWAPAGAEIVQIRPCAFGTTMNRRPWIRSDENRLTISGCNGLAAKCCQALAKYALATSGWVDA